MGEFLKEIVANVTSLMLAIVVLLLAVAILGFIPFGSDPKNQIHLNVWQRSLFGFIAIGIPLAVASIKYFSSRTVTEAPTDEEYESRFDAAKNQTESIIPEQKILAEHEFRNVRLTVYNADISIAKADVLVSSDDNYLQAKGGVAKAILDKAGKDTLRELNYYRKLQPKLAHGDIVVTTGGQTEARAIIHPAVIDLIENRYPNQMLIRKIVQRCLACGIAFGARSIAFPVLGGGTASKHLRPWDSIQAIVAAMLSFLEQYNIHVDGELGHISLYVYDATTIGGDLESLFATKPN